MSGEFMVFHVFRSLPSSAHVGSCRAFLAPHGHNFGRSKNTTSAEVDPDARGMLTRRQNRQLTGPMPVEFPERGTAKLEVPLNPSVNEMGRDI